MNPGPNQDTRFIQTQQLAITSLTDPEDIESDEAIIRRYSRRLQFLSIFPILFIILFSAGSLYATVDGLSWYVFTFGGLFLFTYCWSCFRLARSIQQSRYESVGKQLKTVQMGYWMFPGRKAQEAWKRLVANPTYASGLIKTKPKIDKVSILVGLTGAGLIIGSGIAAANGVAFGPAKDYKLLKKQGVVVTGMATQVIKPESGEKGPTYRVTYTFTPKEGGYPVTGRANLLQYDKTATAIQQVQLPDHAIQVRYLPSNPKINNAEANF